MSSAPSSIPIPRDASIVIPVVAGIGNALLAVPMVRQIKRQLPGSRITILARIEAMAEVFRRLPEVDETVVTGKGIKGLLRMIGGSRARRPDVYLVPFPSNRWQYSMLAATSGATRKVLHSYPIGYWRAMRFLPAMRVEAIQGIHDVEQNLNLLSAFGLDPGAAESPIFTIDDQDRAAATSRLREAGIDESQRLIVIHAGSAQTILAQAKRWSTTSYRQLIERLSQEFGDRIVLVEGPDEAGVANEILPGARIIRLSGPLAHAGAILERAALYVGSDSGLAHLAGAVGTPAVTIFAPADPDRVCPFGYRDLVVQTPASCAPCFQYPWKSTHPKMCCREPFCIGQVTVDAVLAKVRIALARAERPASRSGSSADSTANSSTVPS